MSDALSDLLKSGGLDDPLEQGNPLPQKPFVYRSEVAPTKEDIQRIAESEYNVSTHNALMGTIAGAGVEIGTGMGMSVLNAMRHAKKVKNAALVATVTPEPTSTIVGVASYAATEAAIWGFSNFLGQSTRKAFGIQDHYSGGEMLAASVFGTGVVATKAATGVGKVLELAPSMKSMNGWKSMPVAREGAKTFITGAGLGFAESLLRQEVQIALGERETRDVVDYAVSGAFGGSFNTLFSVFGRTGLWGLNRAQKMSESALRNAEEALERAKQIKNPRKRRKEVIKIQEAIEHLKEVEAGFRDAAKVEAELDVKTKEGEQLPHNADDPRQAPKLEEATTTPEAAKDRAKAITVLKSVDDNAERWSNSGQKNAQITTEDGTVINLKEGSKRVTINGRETVADTELDLLLTPEESRGKGNASRLLGRVLDEIDNRDMSVMLEVSPTTASKNSGVSEGLNTKQLISFYEKRGFIFEEGSTRGYRPRKSENRTSFESQTTKAPSSSDEILKDIHDNVNQEGFNVRDSENFFNSPSILRDRINNGQVKTKGYKLTNDYTSEGDDAYILYYYDGSNLKRVDDYIVKDKSSTAEGDIFPNYTVEKIQSPATKTPEPLYEFGNGDSIPVNADGTITLYHRTNANPDEIKKSGGFVSKENTDEIFVSTKRDGQAEGYGENVVELKVKQDDLEIDDLFDDEAHFRVSINKANEALEAPATPKDTPEPTPAPQNLESDFKPKKVKAAGDTYPVYKVKVNGKDVYIGSSDTMGLGRIFHVTDKDGMEHLTLSGEALDKTGGVGAAADDLTDAFETRKELIAALQKQVKENPEPTPAPKTPDPEPTPAPKSNLRPEIDALADSISTLQGKDLLAAEPELSRRATRLGEQIDPDFEARVESISVKYNNGEELSNEEIDQLLNVISDLRALNDSRDRLKTAVGRSMQGFQSKSDRYVWETSFSYRAIKENAALMDVEQALLKLKQGEKPDDFLRLADEYSKIEGEVNKQGRLIFGQEEPEGSKDKEFEDLSPEEQSAQIARKVQEETRKKIKSLEKQLEAQRSLMMDGMDAALNKKQKNALEKEVEKRLKENPTIQTLNAKLKYYKALQKEADEVLKAEEELARLSAIEGESVVGQLKAEVDKPKKTKVGVEDAAPSKLTELRKKITESKARMRVKLKDIETAEREANKLDLFMALQSHATRNLENDVSSGFVKFTRAARSARKLSLIDQLPSVMAGVPTAVGLAMRSAMRPFVMAPLDLSRYGADTATKLFVSELHGLATTILNWNGTMTSMGRTFMRGTSATDRVTGKFLEDAQASHFRMGNRVDIDRAVKTAQARIQQKSDPMANPIDIKNDGFWAILSLGVRGISAIDDGARRQFLRGRLQTAARRKSILNNLGDDAAAEADFQKSMKTMWGKAGGLDVLKNYQEHIMDVNEVNQNLLFRAQMDDPEMFHKNMGERVIEMLGQGAKGDDALAFAIDALMPYISVPIRGVYRGVRFSAAPFAMGKAVFANPYQAKIKNKQRAIEGAELETMKMRQAKDFDENNPEYTSLIEQVQNNRRDIETLEERKMKYMEEAYVDTAFGGSLLALGFLGAMYGQATGSLNWMTKDQKDKNKLDSFKLFGMDYSAAQPWSIPIAIGADIAAYKLAKDAGALNEKQNPVAMVSSTIVELTEQVPLFEGFKTMNSLASGSLDTKVQQLNRLAASYVPIPAQIRKTLMAASEDQTIGDLRGGTFAQRQAYAFFGVKPINKKTDYFGEDIKSNKTWVQHAIIRQAPTEMPEFENAFERILASDVYDNIESPPSTLGNKIKMTNFIDDEGMTLQYAYSLRLRDFRMVHKGKRQTLKQAVDRLVNTKAWRDKYERTKVSESLSYTNEGLRELNKLMQTYYRAVREDIIDDDNFTKRFVNSDDGSLYDVINREQQTIQGITKPMRELLNFEQ